MIEIKNFFDKFLKIQKNNKDSLDNIINIIYNVTKIKILESEIEIKENSIYIKCKPIYRNEIFMNIERIKEELRKNGLFKKLN